MSEDAAIGLAATQQLVMRALIDEFALAQDQDLVGPADLREAMGDQQGSTALQHPMDSALNLVLGGAVDGASRVVQDQDARIGQQGARDGDALALASGERYPTFANLGLVPLFEAHDKLMSLCIVRSPLDGPAIGLLAKSVGNILGDRAREEKDVLLDCRDLRAQGIQVPIAHVNAIDQDAPGLHVVDAIDQFGKCALTRPRLADNGDRLTRLGTE